MKKVNLIGQKIGMLTVVSRKTENKRSYYLCKCDCGNEKWIRIDSIKSGKQKSCGCLKELKRNDITGKRFGKLVALEISHKDKNGRYHWKCKCDCGNIKIISNKNLIEGSTRSCGCSQYDKILNNREKAFKTHLDKNIVDNTNISIIKNNKAMKHNTSGVKGVSFDNSRQKWRAQIYFKNKHYYLGRYDKKEDAIKARTEAEEKLHKQFLREKGLID